MESGSIVSLSALVRDIYSAISIHDFCGFCLFNLLSFVDFMYISHITSATLQHNQN